MNTKTIIAALVGAVVAFLLGWLVWGILLMDYFRENTYQYEGLMVAEEEFKLWAIFIHNLCNAFLLAWVFTRSNVRTLAGGFQNGAIINFLVSLGFAMMFYSMMNWYKGPAVIAVNVIVNTIFGGVVGAVIAMILGRETKTA
jgi:hypothetical protein